MMEIELVTLVLPETFTPNGGSLSIANHLSGQVLLPAHWYGRDFEGYWQASRPRDDITATHPWLRQWQWAKELVIEWHVSGLPTNPNQIKDDDVPFGFLSYLPKNVHRLMMGYIDDNFEAMKESIEFPSPDNLTAHEFFEWEETVKGMDDSDSLSNMLKTWRTGYDLVRSWGDRQAPDKDGMNVDLALVAAVNACVGETMTAALDLGKWRSPPGGL